MMKMKKAVSLFFSLLACLTLISCSQESEKAKFTSNITDAEMKAGQDLISENCSGCHMATDDGKFSRISHIRKTPEGWDMNIARMMIFHGIEVEPEDRRKLVKFLSDTQGLAPSETVKHRDVLEKKHNVIEEIEDQDLMNMCARCHTYTRVALQRRDVQEWRNLVHMHLGQWASIEYQMLARERDWRADALGPVAEKLAKKYPLSTKAWTDWVSTEWKDMSGEWRIVGHFPGTGAMEGIMTIDKTSQNDKYKNTYNLHFSDGKNLTGTGSSIIHSGYEWRGSAKLNGEKYRQIWAASTDGNKMTGRFYKKSHPEEGIKITAWRKEQAKGVMSITPSALKVGQTTEITINGVQLSGNVTIDGATIKIKSQTADKIIIIATADKAGLGKLKIGKIDYAQDFPLYDQVDYLKVTPDYGISRVGGGGGPIAKVQAQFEAIGYLNGPDGTPNTPDDVRLGTLPVTWSVDNYNEGAAQMEDKRFSGHITQTGNFIPAVAGPNPLRKYGTNNAGDLKIIAAYDQNDVQITAEAHLIATVQRWNNPPIP